MSDVAEFTKIDLRKARESQKWPRWKLAGAIGVSEDTIERWENTKDPSMPTADDVDKIEEALGLRHIWHQWMLTNCDSYRKRYGDVPDYGLTAAIVSIRHAADEVLDIQKNAEVDALDGHFDNLPVKERYVKGLQILLAKVQHALEYLRD